jgi:hypothetical protein
LETTADTYPGLFDETATQLNQLNTLNPSNTGYENHSNTDEPTLVDADWSCLDVSEADTTSKIPSFL